jgi:hypothetical protein
MTTLVVRTKTVMAKIVDLGRQEVGVQLAQRLTEISQRAEVGADRIRKAMGLIEGLNEAGVPVPPPDRRTMEMATSARTRLRTVATRLEAPTLEEPAAIQLLDGSSFQQALKDAGTVIDRLTGLITNALETERQTLLPAEINESVPDVPGKISSVVGLNAKRELLLREVSITAEMLSLEGPDGILAQREARLQAVAAWNEDYPKLLEAFEREPPDLQAFLRAVVSPAGARLSLLTESVRRRLEEDDRLDEFRIRSS